MIQEGGRSDEIVVATMVSMKARLTDEDFLKQLFSTSLVLRLAVLSTVAEELHKCNPKLAEELQRLSIRI